MRNESDNIFISLIVSTRNRGPALTKCLDAISKLDSTRTWELIVVDNGSTDNTRDVVETFRLKSGMNVLYTYEKVPGLSSARNAGLSIARGEVIAFTDDDCYVETDYLNRLTLAFDDPSIGFVTGRVMLFDPTDFRVTINESTVYKHFAAGRYLAPGEVKGANMAFRKIALDQISGFDTDFGSGSLFPSEDCDAAARVSLAGWAGTYDPTVCVYHHHGRKANNLKRLYRDYDVGRGAYHAKLLLHCRKAEHFMQGLRGLPRRAIERPSAVFWEFSGAFRYAMTQMKGPTARSRKS